ncbi:MULTISPECIES: hypothetical protein [unclassified Streptomyces]|uniref:hypothetical protein n=1 Tax=unclassified Streptomyces TaxID=2593676 RepID=UPI002E13F58F|nr:hypothetical protein OG452_15770 [Streptomyces sp. NBC_01197]WSS50662.1 hypothetical protein OG708_19745 [Streptomyces sp. NBC_01180]
MNTALTMGDDEGSSAGMDEGGSWKDDSWNNDQDGSWNDQDGGRDHGRPHGGMHTGGGGLAANSGVAAGSVLLLGGVGAGIYMVRRRRNASGLSVA